MKTFKNYVTEESDETNVAANKRVGIQHFNAMKPVEFVQWANSIKKEFNGVLKGIKTVLKVDGLGFRFGTSASGVPFIEGSRTGPIFELGAFSKYAKSKGAEGEILARAYHYDDIQKMFLDSKIVKSLPFDVKIECELFYNPMSQETEDGIKFVTVKYDKKKLGTKASILPYVARVSSTGEVHPDSDKIIDNLIKQSTAEIMVIDPSLKMDSIDINAIIDPISAIDDNALAIITSRKKVDKESKAQLISMIQQVKDQLSEYVMFNPNICGLDRLCSPENNEGIVIHLPHGVFKMTSKKFQQDHH